jgi:hypothetical protein
MDYFYDSFKQQSDRALILGKEMQDNKNFRYIGIDNKQNATQTETKAAVECVKDFSYTIQEENFAKHLKFVDEKIAEYADDEKIKKPLEEIKNKIIEYEDKNNNRKEILKKDQQTYMEQDVKLKRKISNTGEMFLLPEKTTSLDDVAKVFHQQLSNKAVEHAYAAYIKNNGEMVIQAISTGTPTSTSIEFSTIATMAENKDIKEVVFVHNHPSGAKLASGNDRNCVGTLKQIIPSKCKLEAIIIPGGENNNYTLYDDKAMSETKEITSDKELKNKTEAISVDKIEVIAPPTEQLCSSRDVANHVNPNNTEDIIALITNNQNVITAKVKITKDVLLSESELKKAMINAGTEFAGNHVFMTTKIDFSKDEIDKIQKNIKHFNNTLKGDRKIYDFVSSCKDNLHYLSMMDANMINEKEKEYKKPKKHLSI